MTRYLALLRGINVGGNKLVPMASLRALLESLGYRDVATLLQSGNAVFTSKGKPAQVIEEIESALGKKFGFTVSIVLRTRDELAAVIKANPFPDKTKDAARLAVTFLSGAPDKQALAALQDEKYRPDEYRVAKREIYSYHPNGMGRSKLALALGSPKLGATPTARNWNTVNKLLALADS